MVLLSKIKKLFMNYYFFVIIAVLENTVNCCFLRGALSNRVFAKLKFL